MHHIFTEDVLVENCMYCSQKLDGSWDSEFFNEIHYKSIRCSCGKTHRIKVDVLGSGHDDLITEKKKQLNSKIIVLEDRVKKESSKKK